MIASSLGRLIRLPQEPDFGIAVQEGIDLAPRLMRTAQGETCHRHRAA
ncbi:hypothetical protein ABS735_00715 [Streptomyces sp. MMCC 100]